ncbi:uncharacterized protein LOC121424363 [Lytechinus variegatus]|uniref:uncharacterized protein LOC121424363 n=1 Tax=Lytechinus variegatus TaxID=7654 RepID=UPI001BB2A7D0|nr:uncharacterized protein LOC121424363 [Lytechinus variegatus]
MFCHFLSLNFSAFAYFGLSWYSNCSCVYSSEEETRSLSSCSDPHDIGTELPNSHSILQNIDENQSLTSCSDSKHVKNKSPGSCSNHQGIEIESLSISSDSIHVRTESPCSCSNHQDIENESLGSCSNQHIPDIDTVLLSSCSNLQEIELETLTSCSKLQDIKIQSSSSFSNLQDIENELMNSCANLPDIKTESASSCTNHQDVVTKSQYSCLYSHEITDFLNKFQTEDVMSKPVGSVQLSRAKRGSLPNFSEVTPQDHNILHDTYSPLSPYGHSISFEELFSPDFYQKWNSRSLGLPAFDFPRAKSQELPHYEENAKERHFDEQDTRDICEKFCCESQSIKESVERQSYSDHVDHHPIGNLYQNYMKEYLYSSFDVETSSCEDKFNTGKSCIEEMGKETTFLLTSGNQNELLIPVQEPIKTGFDLEPEDSISENQETKKSCLSDRPTGPEDSISETEESKKSCLSNKLTDPEDSISENQEPKKSCFIQ